MHFTSFENSLVGPLFIAAEEGLVRRIAFSARPDEGWIRDDDALAFARRALEQYFAGHRPDLLKTIPYRYKGTPFQEAVWAALTQIPYGATLSYGELAGRLGQPGAARAVGMANHQNPLPILIPCHRVIGASGALVGFGGGLPLKRKLLELEGGLPQLALPF